MSEARTAVLLFIQSSIMLLPPLVGGVLIFRPVSYVLLRYLPQGLKITIDLSGWPLFLSLLAYSVWKPISESVFKAKRKERPWFYALLAIAFSSTIYFILPQSLMSLNLSLIGRSLFFLLAVGFYSFATLVNQGTLIDITLLRVIYSAL